MQKCLQISAQCLRVKDKAPEGTQLTLASATFPTDLNSILSGFMDVSAIRALKKNVNFSTQEDSFEKISTPGLHKLMPQITQSFFRMGKIHKPEHLLKYAKQLQASKTPTLIFR
jgi:ATP-dependent RNA helicase DDX28